MISLSICLKFLLQESHDSIGERRNAPLDQTPKFEYGERITEVNSSKSTYLHRLKLDKSMRRPTEYDSRTGLFRFEFYSHPKSKTKIVSTGWTREGSVADHNIFVMSAIFVTFIFPCETCHSTYIFTKASKPHDYCVLSFFFILKVSTTKLQKKNKHCLINV